MIIKVLLIANAICYFLLGLAFIFVLGPFTSGMGALSAMGEVFGRALGGVFIGMGLISWYAKGEKQSRLLWGILLGNVVAHLLQAAGDLYAIQRGILNSSGFISIGIHAVLGIAFLSFLLNSRK